MSITAILIALAVPTVTAVGLFAHLRHKRRELTNLRTAWGLPKVRRRDMDAIAEYDSILEPAQSPEGRLDQHTWTDLNLDDVFALLDRAESPLGQQVLYHRLRAGALLSDREVLEAVVTRFELDSACRERIQSSLMPLRGSSSFKLAWLARFGVLVPRRWFVLFPVSAGATFLMLLALPFWPKGVLILAGTVVANMVIRAAAVWRIAPIVLAFRQIGPLLATARVIARLGGAGFDQVNETLDGDIAKLSRLGKVTRWVGRDIQSDGDWLAAAVQYLNLIFLLDLNALLFSNRQLEKHRDTLLRVCGAVGFVDACLAVASYRTGTEGWTRPSLADPGPEATLGGIKHPVVKAAVPNSLQLGHPRGLLLTGSNMSGKSTLLRTTGVNVVLAQALNTCLATSYQAPVLVVRSFMGRDDDILAGRSYYLAEAERVLELLRTRSSRLQHLFLFDELFRGTNNVERLALSEAVLRELVPAGDNDDLSSDTVPHFVVVATHDRELIDLLHMDFAAFHFSDTLGSGGLTFDFMLRPGVTHSRNAIALLRERGASEQVIERAMARVRLLEAPSPRQQDR